MKRTRRPHRSSVAVSVMKRLLKKGCRKGMCARYFHSKLRAHGLVSLFIEYSLAQYQVVSCLSPIIADSIDEIHLAYE